MKWVLGLDLVLTKFLKTMSCFGPFFRVRNQSVSIRSELENAKHLYWSVVWCKVVNKSGVLHQKRSTGLLNQPIYSEEDVGKHDCCSSVGRLKIFEDYHAIRLWLKQRKTSTCVFQEKDRARFDSSPHWRHHQFIPVPSSWQKTSDFSATLENSLAPCVPMPCMAHGPNVSELCSWVEDRWNSRSMTTLGEGKCSKWVVKHGKTTWSHWSKGVLVGGHILDRP